VRSPLSSWRSSSAGRWSSRSGHPLLLVNVAVALLLLRVLIDDVGLSPPLAAVGSLFIVLPSPSTTAQLLEANGGSIETFLCVLLLWLLRDRPVWCGLVLGFGCCNGRLQSTALSVSCWCSRRGDTFSTGWDYDVRL